MLRNADNGVHPSFYILNSPLEAWGDGCRREWLGSPHLPEHYPAVGVVQLVIWRVLWYIKSSRPHGNLTIKEITFLKVAQNKPTQANNGISMVILKSELYHVNPSPSIRTAVLMADYGTLFHQIKHQRDVVKATYGPLSKVVSLALHKRPHPAPRSLQQHTEGICFGKTMPCKSGHF